jgi:hypothetical protein
MCGQGHNATINESLDAAIPRRHPPGIWSGVGGTIRPPPPPASSPGSSGDLTQTRCRDRSPGRAEGMTRGAGDDVSWIIRSDNRWRRLTTMRLVRADSARRTVRKRKLFGLSRPATKRRSAIRYASRRAHASGRIVTPPVATPPTGTADADVPPPVRDAPRSGHRQDPIPRSARSRNHAAPAR